MELTVPCRIPGDESWSGANKRILSWNEAQLNFVSLRSDFHGVGAKKVSLRFGVHNADVVVTDFIAS